MRWCSLDHSFSMRISWRTCLDCWIFAIVIPCAAHCSQFCISLQSIDALYWQRKDHQIPFLQSMDSGHGKDHLPSDWMLFLIFPSSPWMLTIDHKTWLCCRWHVSGLQHTAFYSDIAQDLRDMLNLSLKTAILQCASVPMTSRSIHIQRFLNLCTLSEKLMVSQYQQEVHHLLGWIRLTVLTKCTLASLKSMQEANMHVPVLLKDWCLL